MKVFISWSKSRSKPVAFQLRKTINQIFGDESAWLSEKDIRSGEPWHDEIVKALKDCEIAVLCLTSENVKSSWLLFEAGAIAASVEPKRVIPYLIYMDSTDLRNSPLEMYQAREANKQGTWQVIKDIANWKECEKEELREQYSSEWPNIEKVIYSPVSEYLDSRFVQKEIKILFDALEQFLIGPDRRIYFLGSKRSIQSENFHVFDALAKSLGSIAAEKKFHILVGSTPGHTIDHWVVKGANEYSLNTNQNVEIEYHYPTSQPPHIDVLFQNSNKSKRLDISKVKYLHASDGSWRDTRLGTIQNSNIILVLGGMTSLGDVNEIIALLKKDKKRKSLVPLVVPIPIFKNSNEEDSLVYSESLMNSLKGPLEELQKSVQQQKECIQNKL